MAQLNVVMSKVTFYETTLAATVCVNYTKHRIRYIYEERLDEHKEFPK